MVEPKKVIISVLLLILCCSVAMACEMVAIKALNGKNLSADFVNGNRTKYLFDYFKEIGYQENPASTQEKQGFGMVFYLNNQPQTRHGVIKRTNGTQEVSDRRFAHNGLNASYETSNFNPGTVDNIPSLSILGHTINYAHIRTALGHKRNATTGDYNVPDPHPFVYRNNGRSYSFAHNGTIVSHQSQMNAYISNNSHLLTSDSELLTVYNTGMSGTTRLDSAVYFTYLLIHIINKDMDILRGLHTALNSLTFYSSPNSNQHNFIFSDGYDIYAYKNGQHGLFYYDFTENKIAIVTSQNTNGIIASNILETPSGYNAAYTKTPLENRTLLYIPQHGNSVTFTGFTAQNQIVTIQRYHSQGWSWYGFPIIPFSSQSMRQYFELNYERSEPLQGNPLIISRIEAQSAYAAFEPGFNWAWGDFFNEDIHQNIGLKLKTIGDYAVSASGILAPIEQYTETFYPGNKYWVTYTLTSGQSVKDALGPYYSRVSRVEADNWIFGGIHIPEQAKINTDAQEVNPRINSTRPMEFGKTYLISLFSNAEPITNFKWTDSRQPASGRLNRKAEYFEYEQKMEYEAIDILTLENNMDDYLEIGVFANETCIGATGIDEFPVQILIYSEGYEGTPLTFRALKSNGIVSEIDPIVELTDAKSGMKSKQKLIAGQIDYVIANLDINEVTSSIISPVSIYNHSVYPNPFNPSTTIKFSLSNTSNVSIDIYNIKGQQVVKLFNGSLPSGNHYIGWNGANTDHNPVSSGIYLYKISTDSSQVVGKMMMIK